MSKRKPRRRRRSECYIALEFWELESPAFKHLSADATRVYLFLRKEMDFDTGNNGSVRFSHRTATEALRAGWRRGSNALAELEHYGFIKLRNGIEIGPNVRLVSEWQLTAFPCRGQPASKDFMRWAGTVFEPPYRRQALEKQTPIVTVKTPRRHGEDARHSESGKVPPKMGQTVGTVKTVSGVRRLHREGSSTVTTQEGPFDGGPLQLSWHAPTYVELTPSECENGQSAPATAPKTADPPKTPPARRARAPQHTYLGRPVLRNRVLDLLRSRPDPWTRKEIVAALELRYGQDAQRVLVELCEVGLAKRLGWGCYCAGVNGSNGHG